MMLDAGNPGGFVFVGAATLAFSAHPHPGRADQPVGTAAVAAH